MPILDEYDAAAPLYRTFTDKIYTLVHDLIKINDIHVHTIVSRVKDRYSLERKLTRDLSKYSSLDDITDIAGVRIIMYFENDIHRVSQIIEKEFDIDFENSVNKQNLLDPDRFGYLSLHYIVKLTFSRRILPEYQAFDALTAEIQIRSILQHAWAEIEHDLGYKTDIGVPREVRRRFARTAGLLELVDQEFIGIQHDLKEYNQRVGRNIAKHTEAIDIDRDSIGAYIVQSSTLHRIDKKISEVIRIKITDKEVPSHYEQLATYCVSVGIKTIAELESALLGNENLIIEFSSENDREYPAGQKEGKDLLRGVGIYYLCNVIIAKTGNLSRIKAFVHRHSGFRRFEKRERHAEFL